MEGSEGRSGGNHCMWNSLRHSRVESDDKQIPVIKILVVKKRIDKNQWDPIEVWTQLKFAPKLTLSKLKKNTLCLPDVVEDDRVWISKARDRVVK